MTAQIRVVPDGALFDRVGEFAFGQKEWVLSLLHRDPGYSKALVDIVQTLALSAKIVVGDNPRAPRTTGMLAKRLQAEGRLEKSQFFSESQSFARKAGGYAWVSKNWSGICEELSRSDLPAREGMAGHLCREVHYYWLRKDPNWSPFWYSSEEDSLPVPETTLRYFLRAVAPIVRQHHLAVTEKDLRVWIRRNVTTHYRIFGEYLLFLGGDQSSPEYMPAHTRSCLQFIAQETERNDLDEAVLPFIGLSALKKVKHRRDIIPRVIEWSEKEGKDIVAGFYEFRQIYNSTAEGQFRSAEIKKVEDILQSKYSRNQWMILGLLKAGRAISEKRFDEALEALLNLPRSKSYRWLWRIRNPEYPYEWQAKLKELLQA